MSHNAREVEAYLRGVVVGQDDAVRSLAVAVGQHYARIAYTGTVHTKKANVLLVGPTGVGKTLMCRALADYLDVPFAQVSAAAITQPGFTGLDPDAVLWQLWQHAGKKGRDRAGVGIALIDEVDKIARKDTDESEKARNLTTGLGVQQSLLDVLDAGKWTFAEGPFKGQEMDASGVLFICSGAFVGIERFVAYRMRSGARVAAPHPLSQTEALRSLEPGDLVSYGLIPELVGRLPVLVTLRPLDAHELVRIMSESVDGPMPRLAAEFAGIGASLVVDPLWMHRIAAEAIAKGTGARAIESVLRPALRDAFYAAGAGDTVLVNAEGSWRIEKSPPTPPSPSSDEAQLAEEPAAIIATRQTS